MAKLNVKLWKKSANISPDWLEDRAAVSIFPDRKGMIYVRTHNWVNDKNGYSKAAKLDECVIEIEEEGFGIVFDGTIQELFNKLKEGKS